MHPMQEINTYSYVSLFALRNNGRDSGVLLNFPNRHCTMCRIKKPPLHLPATRRQAVRQLSSIYTSLRQHQDVL